MNANNSNSDIETIDEIELLEKVQNNVTKRINLIDERLKELNSCQKNAQCVKNLLIKM